MKKLIFGLIVFLGSMSVFAGESVSNQTVNFVETGWGAEGIYVQTDSSANKCGLAGRFFIRPDHPLLKIMVTELMLAINSGNKVNIYIEGCHGSEMNVEAVGIAKK